MQVIKCTILGDSSCGITNLLQTYADYVSIADFSPTPPVPEIFYETNILVDDQPVTLRLCCMFMLHESSMMRPAYYKGGTDVFVIGFSVLKPCSLDSVSAKWIPEVRQHYADTSIPVVLVGIISDLRDDDVTIKTLKEENVLPVSYEQGLTFAKDIDAVKYLECCALKTDEVKEVFEEANRAALYHKIKKSKCKKRKCIIL